jgi:hypothetical protein
MWISSKVIDWFSGLRDAADTANTINIAILNELREELASAKTERDLLKIQAAVNQTNFDWLRMRVNTLEIERAGLIQKAYGITLPVPEIAKKVIAESGDDKQFSFADIGEDLARQLGYPSYDEKK